MTWTPREDAALLRAKTKLHVLLTPALQQSQWQEVAWGVAEATSAELRSADDCQQRYATLLASAKTTDKAQWPGDKKMHELLEAALEKEAASKVVEATSKDNERPANNQMSCDPSRPPLAASTQTTAATPSTVIESAAGAGTSSVVALTAPPRSLKKRPRGYEGLKEWTIVHDELVLRAVGEIKQNACDKCLWTRVAIRVTTESLRDVLPSKCKTRYHELMQLSEAEIHARYGDNQALRTLVETAQENFRKRASESHSGGQTERELQGVPPSPLVATPIFQRTLPPRAATLSSSPVVDADVVDESTTPAALPAQAAAETNEEAAAAPATLAMVSGSRLASAEQAPAEPPSTCTVPEPDDEEQPSSEPDQDELSEMKDEVKMIARTLVLLRAEADRAHAERVELTSSLKRIQDLTATSCRPITQGPVDGDAGGVNGNAEQVMRARTKSRIEVQALRTELDLVKRALEQSEKEETVRRDDTSRTQGLGAIQRRGDGAAS